MSQRKWIGGAVMALSLVCGVGSLALFAVVPLGTVRAPAPWPLALVLAWDTLLSFLFFLQHSGMVRRTFRARLAAVIPVPYHRALYSIASGVALVLVVLLWQPTSAPLFPVPGAVWPWISRGASLCAAGIFLWGAVAVRDLDFFGLRAIRSEWRRQPPTQTAPPQPVLVVRGPYRWVRHPWYFAILLIFWSTPAPTADRLLFNLLWTAWIYVGATLEEKDLLDAFGAPYARYRRTVPMLLPWRGPAARP